MADAEGEANKVIRQDLEERGSHSKSPTTITQTPPIQQKKKATTRGAINSSKWLTRTTVDVRWVSSASRSVNGKYSATKSNESTNESGNQCIK